jgi:hypothetical protein
MLDTGDKAPAFTLPDQDGKSIKLSDLKGRKVLVYFYPRSVAGAAFDRDHLDHGYALTVHRDQGDTADRTHNLAEGGGRELAYVAMSRARGPSIVHTVADGLDQAIDDITHDWSLDRNQKWITRDAAVGADPTIQTLPEDPQLRRTRLVAELEALERHAPPDVTAELSAARANLERLRASRDDVTRGTGRWRHTPAGHAAR